MKKNTTIHVLPELKAHIPFEEFEKHLELAATIDYVPDSIKTLQSIDYYDLKYMMEYNDNFFDTVVEMCSETIEEMIADAKEDSGVRRVQKAVTLEDLLKSGYYGEDYDVARDEFIYCFLNFYLGDIGKKKKAKKKAPKKVEVDVAKGIEISSEDFEKTMNAKSVSEVPDSCKSIFGDLVEIMVPNKTLEESIYDMVKLILS